jgi:putative restriction endonuclease
MTAAHGTPIVNAEKWLARFARLKIDKARGDPAPHKPLLLLVVLELAEQGLLPEDLLPLSPELAFRFQTFWNVIAHRRSQRPDVRLPFHHLQSGGFWSALDENGNPSPDKRLTRYAALDGDFVAFAKDPVLRDRARRILIGYFQPPERVALSTLVGLPVYSEKEIVAETADTWLYYARKQGREARFRLVVVAAYDYTCVLTGYRLTTITAGSIVDAAHIHQFADSRNNDPRNGLALCKNAHWLFDQGLWTIADDYTVIVATGQFAEQSPDQKPLHDYHGRKIRLPSNPALWPDPVHLAWHRARKFQRI